MSSCTLRAAASAHALMFVASLAAPAFAQAGPFDEPQQRDTVIVTATRDPEDPPVVAEARQRLSETPGAVAVVSSESYANRFTPGLSEMLRDVPGVYVQKKWGGDTRLSIRGSGIGNPNHLRGTVVAQDGIPLNEADGFGDTQLVDPAIARFTEVYKGGNALRYGGALLGGAINIVTPTGKTMPATGLARIEGGQYGTLRGHAEAGGQFGAWDGFAAVTGQTAEGWRRQSEGQQQFASANLGYTLGEDREVRAYLSGGYIHQQIPGSVTLAQALSNPEAAAAANVNLNYQRDQSVVRGVVQSRWRFDANTVLEGGVYATWKDLDHPIFQVIDQESRNYGVFGRMDWTGDFIGRPADLFYGLSYRSGDLDANQWVNLSGSKGAQTAESRQNAKGLDVFAEGRLFVTDDIALIGGGSYGKAERDYQSYAPSAIVVATNKDYDWFAPRIGVLWQNDDGIQIYGNITQSVEPPNFSSLAPTTGGFQPLKPQEAWTGEVGTRGRVGAFIWDVAFYHAKLRKELLTYAVNPAQGIPAPTFNADETTHQGLEAGLDWEIMNGLRLRQTYMWSDFRFEDDVQYSDNRLPVVPEHFYRAELRYRTQGGFWIAPSVEWSIKDTFVDYMNTLKAPSYGVFNLGLGQELKGGVSLFVDIRNLTDERYVSNFTAVTNARTASTAVFFPGDARSVYGGVAFTF